MSFSRMIWAGGNIPYTTTWEYWTSQVGVIPHLGVTKTNRFIAYYATVRTQSGYKSLLISPKEEAVAYDGYTSQGSLYDYHRWAAIYDVDLWYFNMQGGSSDTECLLDDTIYLRVEDAVRSLLNKIYAVKFYDTYVVNVKYPHIYLEQNIGKILKIIYGIFLTSGLLPDPWVTTESPYSDATEWWSGGWRIYPKEKYDYLSDNANSLINEVVQYLNTTGDNFFPYIVVGLCFFGEELEHQSSIRLIQTNGGTTAPCAIYGIYILHDKLNDIDYFKATKNTALSDGYKCQTSFRAFNSTDIAIPFAPRNGIINFTHLAVSADADTKVVSHALTHGTNNYNSTAICNCGIISDYAYLSYSSHFSYIMGSNFNTLYS